MFDATTRPRIAPRLRSRDRSARGAVLVLVVLLMVALMFGAMAFLSVVLSEREVAVIFRSQSLCGNAMASGRAHAIAILEEEYLTAERTGFDGAWRTEFADTVAGGGAEGEYLWDILRVTTAWGNPTKLASYTPYHEWTEVVEIDPDPRLPADMKRWPTWHVVGYYDQGWRPVDTQGEGRYEIRYAVSIIDLSGLLLCNRTVAWDSSANAYEYTPYGGAGGDSDWTFAGHSKTAKALIWKGYGCTEAEAEGLIGKGSRSFVDRDDWQGDYRDMYGWSSAATAWLSAIHETSDTWGSEVEKTVQVWTPFGNSQMVDAGGALLDDPSAVKWQVNVNTAPRDVLRMMILAVDHLLEENDPAGHQELNADPNAPMAQVKGWKVEPADGGPGVETLLNRLVSHDPLNTIVDGGLSEPRGRVHVDGTPNPYATIDQALADFSWESGGTTYTDARIEALVTGQVGGVDTGLKLQVGKSKFFRVCVRGQTYDMGLGMALVSRELEFVYHVDPDNTGLGSGNKLMDGQILYQHLHGGE